MLMKRWTSFIMKGAEACRPVTRWIGRAAYYYLVLMALFILYYVQKQQTAAPFIYNNF
jgi:hypothetical protein